MKFILYIVALIMFKYCINTFNILTLLTCFALGNTFHNLYIFINNDTENKYKSNKFVASFIIINDMFNVAYSSINNIYGTLCEHVPYLKNICDYNTKIDDDFNDFKNLIIDLNYKQFTNISQFIIGIKVNKNKNKNPLFMMNELMGNFGSIMTQITNHSNNNVQGSQTKQTESEKQKIQLDNDIKYVDELINEQEQNKSITEIMNMMRQQEKHGIKANIIDMEDSDEDAITQENETHIILDDVSVE